ncbi:MAG: phosphoserine phosphatase SerB [Alphaproteobacteria bacterium]|nr:phosphoserine phosphatase SerB [Alphaproteobacteria bacterium]
MPEPQSQVLVLTAPEAAPCLKGMLTDTITRIIAKDAVIDSRWLSPGEAWELRFVTQADGGKHLLRQAATILIGLPVDINLMSDEGPRRRKKLLVADMDSTIIEQECIDEIADFAGVRDQVSAVTESAMRGEIDFAEALTSRVALLQGLEEAVLDKVIKERITVMPGARTLVRTMKAHGARAALVSGGFSYFTERIARIVGFDTNQANRLSIEDGRLCGKVVPPILGRDAKRAALISEAGRLAISLRDTLAVGDGANDLAMITEAGLGVAFRAKPIVAAEAKAAIRHGNLKALLYLQGYRRDEFAR